MLKFCFFVPSSHLDIVKTAIFAAGAGIGENYTKCHWQTSGVMSFLPMEGGQPYLGEINKMHSGPEIKVETIVKEELLKTVVDALYNAHPYEDPAFEALQMIDCL